MKLPLLKGYRNIELKYCRSCGSYYYKGKFIPLKEFRVVFYDLLKKHIRTDVKDYRLRCDLSKLKDPAKKFDLLIEISADDPKSDTEESNTITEEAVMEVSVVFEECISCSRIKGGYFEAVIQLRNTKFRLYEDVFARIRSLVEARKRIDISKHKKVRGGDDFYMTDTRGTIHIIDDLQKEFGGSVTISKKLFGMDRQTSKAKYRTYVSLRLPDVALGDIIEYDDEYYKIVSIKKDRMRCEHLMTGKMKNLKLSDRYRIKITRDEYLNVVVTMKKPHTEVLDPETFESVRPANKMEILSNRADVVKIDDTVYLV